MGYLPKWLVQGTASSNTFLLSLSFFLLLLVVLKFKKLGTTKYNLPPSPSKLPIIGNMHQLLQGTLHQALYSLSQKHGPLMMLHLFSKLTLVVSSADTAQAVLKTYDHVFSSRPCLKIPSKLLYQDMAFAPYGEHWRTARKICILELLSSKKVQSFRALREEELAHVMNKIESSLTVNLSDLFVYLSNGIICRAVLGRKYEGGESSFKKIVKECTFLLGVSNIEDFVPSLWWINSINGLNKRVKNNFRDIDAFLDGVIEEHLEKKKTQVNGMEHEEDIVDILLRNEGSSTFGIPITRETTKGMLMDMFIAGTDTSSIVLEWAMSELIRHPQIMIEAQKEVRDLARGKRVLHEDDIHEMHILKAIIKETLRMHPSVPVLVVRESMSDATIQGYHIPAKTTVMVNAFAIGRDPKWWEEPEKFWPKRFLEGNSSSVDFKGQDYQLIPFGAGRRGCPGAVFASALMDVTLANILNRFDWNLPTGMDIEKLDMQEGSGITVSRKVDLVLTARPFYKESS